MAGADRLAVRIPAHDGLRRLLGELGLALTATSANVAGEAPILDPDELRERFGDELSFVVDAGRLAGGSPSTMVAWRAAPATLGSAPGSGQVEVLRAGAFSWPRALDRGDEEAPPEPSPPDRP
jgi:tRNA A37 threonylcarbamoyladenosine synthetase subunit TsaC/SUA5/YrdC